VKSEGTEARRDNITRVKFLGSLRLWATAVGG
jgi:hypothetical protein